jgi:S-adenosylmethionine:diacylglycerol 3-amino-3-carboxypropyl transferase
MILIEGERLILGINDDSSVQYGILSLSPEDRLVAIRSGKCSI